MSNNSNPENDLYFGQTQIGFIEIAGNIDIDKLIEQYAKKTETLPLVMDSICRLIKNYLRSDIEVSKFLETYKAWLPNLYKRILCGREADAYSAAYKDELKLIFSVEKSCDKVQEEDFSSTAKQVFDTEFLNMVLEYVEQPITRTSHFVI